MEFVNPGFLYGLFAISIPVIIHLFNFRRFKKIYFSNVSFIRELKLQTQKQSRLKHLLILLMRMLAIAALVIAFAQPYFPVSDNIINQNEKNVVSIYLDNSFSLQAFSEKGTLFEEAKEKAREIVSVYKDTDLFQLITNDMEGRHHRFISRDEFIDLVGEVSITPVVRTLPEILTRQSVLFEGIDARVKTSYIISDFQRHFLEGDFPPADSSFKVLFIPLKAENTGNLYIDSCWFESPVQQMNETTLLNVKIRNSSDKNYERIPVKLTINGRQKAIASVDIEKDKPAVVTLSYTNYETGIQNAMLEINDFAITFDDKLWFSYYISTITPVLCINGSAQNIFLNSLFKKDSLFRFDNVNEGNIGYSDFINYKLIILNEIKNLSSGLSQQLVPFVQNGGSLMILPAGNSDLQSLNELLRTLNAGSYGVLDTVNTKISFINLEHPLYSNVFDEIPENIDLPVVFKHFPIQINTRSSHESLLEMLGKGSFLSIFYSGKGKVYMSSVPFQNEYSNFQRHAIFVPTLYKIVVSSIINENLYYVIGNDEVISVANPELDNDEVLYLKLRDSDFDIIPEQRRRNTSIDLFTRGQIKQAGNYELCKGDQLIHGISFNYSRKESEMDFYSSTTLAQYIADKNPDRFKILTDSGKPFVQALAEFNQGIRLWKLFVILALSFLMAEILLLRFL